jgi:hypothetical protein
MEKAKKFRISEGSVEKNRLSFLIARGTHCSNLRLIALLQSVHTVNWRRPSCTASAHMDTHDLFNVASGSRMFLTPPLLILQTCIRIMPKDVIQRNISEHRWCQHLMLFRHACSCECRSFLPQSKRRQRQKIKFTTWKPSGSLFAVSKHNNNIASLSSSAKRSQFRTLTLFICQCMSQSGQFPNDLFVVYTAFVNSHSRIFLGISPIQANYHTEFPAFSVGKLLSRYRRTHVEKAE